MLERKLKIKTMSEKKGSPKYSGIDKHKRKGKELKTRLGELNIQPFDWDKDGIPEFLWIDYISRQYGDNPNTNYFNDLLDSIESEIDEDAILLGTISSFGKVPDDKREAILENHNDLLIEAFAKPIGRLFSLYPDCPANWLIPEEWLNKIEDIDPDHELEILEESLLRLYKAKDSYTGHIRMFPLIRILKNGKMRFPKGTPLLDILPRYPYQCSEDEKRLAQSSGRTIVNMFLSSGEFPDGHSDSKWPKHFWRKNFEMTECRTFKDSSSEQNKLPDKFYEELYKGIEKNINICNEYIDQLIKDLEIDIYSPEHEEVLLGLISRLVRLYKILLRDQELWSLDLSRIHLRCMVDTAITICYLIKNDDPTLFDDFIKYGVGKEKLLMLHLQDTHPDEVGPSGEDFEDMSRLFHDSFSPEYTDIDLGSWVNQSTRDMAIEVDLLKEYRLIFDPTSSDIHGTWPSIKNFNLNHCRNPLHRFHKLPNTNEPTKTIYPLSIANQLILKVIDYAEEQRSYPNFDESLYDFSELKKFVNEDDN